MPPARLLSPPPLLAGLHTAAGCICPCAAAVWAQLRKVCTANSPSPAPKSGNPGTHAPTRPPAHPTRPPIPRARPPQPQRLPTPCPPADMFGAKASYYGIQCSEFWRFEWWVKGGDLCCCSLGGGGGGSLGVCCACRPCAERLLNCERRRHGAPCHPRRQRVFYLSGISEERTRAAITGGTADDDAHAGSGEPLPAQRLLAMQLTVSQAALATARPPAGFSCWRFPLPTGRTPPAHPPPLHNAHPPRTPLPLPPCPGGAGRCRCSS